MASRDSQSPGDVFDLTNRHVSRRTAITSANAKQLRKAWTVKTRAPVSHAAIVDHGKAYFSDWSGTVNAVDAARGNVIWKNVIWKNKVATPKRWPWHGLAGTGELVHGTLYESSVEGVLYALDARDGYLKWKTRITKQPYAGTLAPPQYFGGLLYIGLQSVDEPLTKVMPGFKPQSQGHVLAVDARTGRIVWDRALVHPPQNGVPVWGAIAIDRNRCVLYVGTGNNYTGTASKQAYSLIAMGANRPDPLV